jgi:hypothetical protein
MSKTTEIYWDAQEAGNEGWAYRISGGSSGAIDDTWAAEALSDLERYGSITDEQREAIREAVEDDIGVDPSTVVMIDSSGQNLGHLWP